MLTFLKSNVILKKLYCYFIKNMKIIFSNNVIFNFVTRWLFSTNHKDIGTLYLIFAGVSGIAGTVLSLYIRITLATPNSAFLEHNYHLYNVLITGHAITMIFLCASVNAINNAY